MPILSTVIGPGDQLPFVLMLLSPALTAADQMVTAECGTRDPNPPALLDSCVEPPLSTNDASLDAPTLVRDLSLKALLLVPDSLLSAPLLLREPTRAAPPRLRGLARSV